MEKSDTSISSQGVSDLGAEVAQEGDRQETEELSESEEIRQEDRSMKPKTRILEALEGQRTFKI